MDCRNPLRKVYSGIIGLSRNIREVQRKNLADLLLSRMHVEQSRPEVRSGEAGHRGYNLRGIPHNKESRLLETLPPGKLRIIPLGGVGEIGKNMYAYHVLDQILVVDCGLKFLDERMFGVDLNVAGWQMFRHRHDSPCPVCHSHNAGREQTARFGHFRPNAEGARTAGVRMPCGRFRQAPAPA
jgi:hypothetical protein